MDRGLRDALFWSMEMAGGAVAKYEYSQLIKGHRLKILVW